MRDGRKGRGGRAPLSRGRNADGRISGRMVQAAGRCARSVVAWGDPAENQDWARRGWPLVAGFVDADEVEKLRREAERLWADQKLFGERGAVPNSATRGDRLDPVIDLSPPFAALARDPRLMAQVEAVLGGAAQLMKDKFIAKPPGA